jgi:hypothetical protein
MSPTSAIAGPGGTRPPGWRPGTPGRVCSVRSWAGGAERAGCCGWAPCVAVAPGEVSGLMSSGEGGVCGGGPRAGRGIMAIRACRLQQHLWAVRPAFWVEASPRVQCRSRFSSPPRRGNIRSHHDPQRPVSAFSSSGKDPRAKGGSRVVGSREPRPLVEAAAPEVEAWHVLCEVLPRSAGPLAECRPEWSGSAEGSGRACAGRCWIRAIRLIRPIRQGRSGRPCRLPGLAVGAPAVGALRVVW